MPCVQFLNQEPARSPEELRNGIKYVRPGGGYEPNFPLFKKLFVNGEDAHPLYKFLKASCRQPDDRDQFRATEYYLFQSSFNADDISWNWNKFLIDQNGKPVRRYAEGYDVMLIEEDISSLLETGSLPKK